MFKNYIHRQSAVFIIHNHLQHALKGQYLNTLVSSSLPPFNNFLFLHP